jgi:phosphoesterase RecJ-like protein
LSFAWRQEIEMGNVMLPEEIDFSPAIDLLYSAENIIITTHINPDGDAIGSALALYGLASALGKNASIIINESACPETYKFLANSKCIKRYDIDKHKKLIYNADAIFILDVSDLSRIKLMAEPITQSNARKVVIDHHLSPNCPVDVLLSSQTASSTGELIYHLIKQAKIAISKNIAEALYTAIHTDTGGFRFPSTTASIHRIIAELLDVGVEPNYMYENIYNRDTLPVIKLRGMAQEMAELHCNGKLGVMTISDSMFKQTDTTESDTEGFSQIMLSIASVVAAIFLVESVDKDEIRVSLRSKGDVNVRDVAAKYGGGGHLNASGCRLQNYNLDDVKQFLIKDISRIL